jgi:hypothetical protein
MHRRITFQGDSVAITTLAKELEPLDGVIGLAQQRGASLKPAGDVLQVDVLNSTADEVLRRARPRLDDDAVNLTVVILQSNAIIDRRRAHLIETDGDESLWEEMESDLRNHGRVSVNYVLLMALGGVISAAGLLVESVTQAIALVGASIIAPGFEPIAKLTQGLVLRQTNVCGRALLSVGVGYGVLFAAAFLTVLALSLANPGHPHAALLAQPVLEPLTHLDAAPLVTSACAAVAGIVMVVSLRDLYVVGPLMVLVLISGAALAGAALAVGEWGIALGALRRVGSDLALIVVLGAAVFYWKQRRFHRRRPLT